MALNPAPDGAEYW